MWINDKVLPRNIFSKEIRLAWCTKGLLPVVLKGNYAEVANSFAQMNGGKLERYVSRLVKLTTEFVYRTDKKHEVRYMRPKWWPKELPFEHPVSALRKKRPCSSTNWNAILRKIISECAQFYKGEPLDIPRCRNQLYYYINTLGKDENYENKHDRGVKRKNHADLKWSTSPSAKRRKVQNKVKKILVEETKSNVKPAVEVPILKAHAQDDVEEIQKKGDFMQYMQLKGRHNSVTKKPVSCSKPYNPRLYQVPHIPFSSEAGRLLLEKEPQHVSQEVHLRKIERVEWHLKHEHAAKPQNTPQHYEVSYDERKDYQYARNYKFPKRQFHQRHPTLHEVPFLLSICRKRVSVSIKNEDLRELRRKFLIKKELYVRVENMDLTMCNEHLHK